MEKIKLNKDFGQLVIPHGYELDPTKKYVINLENELREQENILNSVQMMGLPALADYHTWLEDNGFDIDVPNPTNAVVSQFYGVKPLWKTEYSQGIVVRDEEDEDYFIVMECSRLNERFKYTQIILTLGGCM
ncbi:hypothetical protein [Ligilactobacillus faecis]|uniref:hypothetical protein n=1 Tax=Ligilactobacillus faecis TaxID=762833 RepID=UPI0024693B58|nr:hypothetical protein [Ligilactobacillus faecis]WGN89561.1 hypothetical protein QFX10_00180 [Ligilactobacillus faecis]